MFILSPETLHLFQRAFESCDSVIFMRSSLSADSTSSAVMSYAAWRSRKTPSIPPTATPALDTCWLILPLALGTPLESHHNAITFGIVTQPVAFHGQIERSIAIIVRKLSNMIAIGTFVFSLL
jgi:hypothetical protein